jgi:hypothetical protein
MWLVVLESGKSKIMAVASGEALVLCHAMAEGRRAREGRERQKKQEKADSLSSGT